MARAKRLHNNTIATATNAGIGKQLPITDCGHPIPAQPRNRRERRAQAAWQRRNNKQQENQR
ncbi:hypothetical protein ACFVH6_22120 [Spirillospora sp. NPDC127200]